MIEKYVTRFQANELQLRRMLSKEHPSSYRDLVIMTLNVIGDGSDFDLDNITLIDNGDYQGTQLFVIPEKGYQPSTYYTMKVGYGSCSGCDTLQMISEICSDDVPTNEQIEGYTLLCLHLIQSMKEI